jgi:hypothetical protein
MAIQRRVYETGIYRSIERTPGVVDSPFGERIVAADGKHIIARAERLGPLERKHWQEHAKRLALATIHSTTPTLPVKRPSAMEAGHTAERLLGWLELMTKARDVGETDKALWYAFAVGRYYESLRIRPSEPYAARGRKWKAERISVGRVNKKKAELRRAEWLRIAGEVIHDDQYLKSRIEVCRCVARRAAKNPKTGKTYNARIIFNAIRDRLPNLRK